MRSLVTRASSLVAAAAVALALVCALGPAVGAVHAQEVGTIGLPAALTPAELAAHGPRFAPDGTHVVFWAGEEGDGDVYVVARDGSGLRRLTEDPADDRDPTFSRDGSAIVWSSNRAGDYDLWQMPIAGGEAERITALAGDELAPAVSPIAFTFEALGADDCSGPFLQPVDAYDKVVFVRRQGSDEAIWFHALGGTHPAIHAGRVSPEGLACRAPAWSPDGLSLTYACAGGDEEPAIYDAPADWSASIEDAAASLRGSTWSEEDGCEGLAGEDWSGDACLAGLARRYVRYDSGAGTMDPNDLQHPGYSANGVLQTASDRSGDGAALVVRERWPGGAGWTPVAGAPSGMDEPVWAPDGGAIAFVSDHEGGPRIYLAPTSFYLQDVVDLAAHPELFGGGRSERLAQNGFVVRRGGEREFFTYYDQLGYRGRAPFVTADAALQVLHDELAWLLREREGDAEAALTRLSRALSTHWLDALNVLGGEDDPVARHLAVTFTVPAVLLDAAAEIVVAGPEEPHMVAECERMRDELAGGSHDGELREWFEQDCTWMLLAPLEEQLTTLVATRVASVPDTVRAEVEAHLARILAHEGVAEVAVPGRSEPLPLDYSQFRLRGHYAGSHLAGYFLALMWYGWMPLPLEPGTFGLPATIDELGVAEDWALVDGLAASVLGRPVDATLPDLRAVASESPALLAPFDRAAVAAALRARVGEVPVRGLAGALGQESAGTVQITLFPRRFGLDAGFFSALTHPNLPRPFPSALDALAGLGVGRAAELVVEGERAEAHHEAYREALVHLVGQSAALPDTYWAGDLYHGWLAMLRALAAEAGVEGPSALPFTQTEAWQDRLVSTALGGYALLVHDAVLYNMQEYGVECGGWLGILGMVERPVIPEPRGFVEPAPRFFREMAALSERVYATLNGGAEPEVRLWLSDPDDEELVSEPNARAFALRLAEIAEREVRGEALGEEDLRWIRRVGATMELLFLRSEHEEAAITGDEGRSERGVAVAADIYTNVMRGEVAQLGIGRVDELFVLVPNRGEGEVGRRVTQGGVFSFYELLRPLGERLDDATWSRLLDAGEAPARPWWTSSFLE
jgi:hypothetical protein